MEGRAARRRLRAVELLRAHRARGAPTRSSPSRRGCARDILARLSRRSTPTACSVIYNGIDAEEYAPDRGHRRARAPRRRPRAAVGRLRRADHAPEGRRRTCSRRRCEFDPGGAARALRGRAGHAGDRRRGRARASSALRAERGNVIWIDEMLPEARRDPAPQPRDGVRLPVDLRAARDRQPRGDGVRDGRRGDARPAASSRSSTTATTGLLVPFEPAPGDAASRATPRRSRRPSPSASTRSSPTRTRAAAMGRAGRERAVERVRLAGDRASRPSALYRSLV